MTTANLAEALPRLQKIRQATGRDVGVSLETWVRKDRIEVEWSIYLPHRHRVCHGATLEDALRLAEFEADLLPTSGLPAVVLP